MSKLLKRAKVQLNIAEDCYRHFADDDAYIDACCYSVQQSIELSLKYIVEMNGEEYAENHDIRANLNKLDKINSNILEPNVKKELRNMASTLYSWETETRYNDDFIAVKDDIDIALFLAGKLIRFSDELVSQVPINVEREYPEGRLEDEITEENLDNYLPVE